MSIRGGGCKDVGRGTQTRSARAPSVGIGPSQITAFPSTCPVNSSALRMAAALEFRVVETAAEFDALLPTPPISPKQPTLQLPTESECAAANNTASDASQPQPCAIALESETQETSWGAVAASAHGFVAYLRNKPVWDKISDCEKELGIQKVTTVHANMNLCLIFSYLVGSGMMPKDGQRTEYVGVSNTRHANTSFLDICLHSPCTSVRSAKTLALDLRAQVHAEMTSQFAAHPQAPWALGVTPDIVRVERNLTLSGRDSTRHSNPFRSLQHR